MSATRTFAGLTRRRCRGREHPTATIIDRIRDVVRDQPFGPVDVRPADGSVHTVASPESIAIPPGPRPRDIIFFGRGSSLRCSTRVGTNGRGISGGKMATWWDAWRSAALRSSGSRSTIRAASDSARSSWRRGCSRRCDRDGLGRIEDVLRSQPGNEDKLLGEMAELQASLSHRKTMASEPRLTRMHESDPAGASSERNGSRPFVQPRILPAYVRNHPRTPSRTLEHPENKGVATTLLAEHRRPGSRREGSGRAARPPGGDRRGPAKIPPEGGTPAGWEDGPCGSPAFRRSRAEFRCARHPAVIGEDFRCGASRIVSKPAFLKRLCRP
jgi:hypothetical protein